MAEPSKAGKIWEDISAGYKRSVGELHAAMFPEWPSAPDSGSSAPSHEIETKADAEKDSVLTDRLQKLEQSREDKGRDDRDLDRE